MKHKNLYYKWSNETNLKFFDKIDACGLREYSSTSMQSLGVKIDNIFWW